MKKIPKINFEWFRSRWSGRGTVSQQLQSFLHMIRQNTTMQMREKTVTAVCRTETGIEWTSWKIKPDGAERIQQSAAAVELTGDTTEEVLSSIQLPEDVKEHLAGEITVPLRTTSLLLRVTDFPTLDDGEIADMVGFQIDKVSPFPQDQLAVSHEVLQQTEESSLVLMAAARRNSIDAIGDTFEVKGVRVHGIDARVMGWLKLLADEDHISSDRCEIIMINDRIDFSMVVIHNGIPMAFRMLDMQPGEDDSVRELAEEIGYTLTTMETERDLPPPSSIHLWTYDDPDEAMRTQLAELSGLPVHVHALGSLPPLSEGIARRTMSGESHIELVPREWIEYERRLQLRRQFTVIASLLAAAWLVVMLFFYTTYKVREVKLGQVQKRLAAIEPDARQALENRQKLKALQLYTDRSDSALECLREVTELLPPGNIEFASYNYKKGKGVTLRGSADNDEVVYDFFEVLTKSDLFVALKDQSVNTKVIKGIRSAVFSVTLDLPAEEEPQ